MIARTLRQAALLCALALAPAVASWALRDRREPPLREGEASAEMIDAWGGERVLWVDARASAEFARRRIPGAVPLNAEEWEAQLPAFLDAWQPEKEIVVYAGARSERAEAIAFRLRHEQGIERVWVLAGGYERWR